MKLSAFAIGLAVASFAAAAQAQTPPNAPNIAVISEGRIDLRSPIGADSVIASDQSLSPTSTSPTYVVREATGGSFASLFAQGSGSVLRVGGDGVGNGNAYMEYGLSGEIRALTSSGSYIAKFLTGVTNSGPTTYITLQAGGGATANIYANGTIANNITLSGKGSAGGTITLGLPGDNTIIGASAQLSPVSNNELDILNFAGSTIAKFITGVTDISRSTFVALQATEGTGANIYASGASAAGLTVSGKSVAGGTLTLGLPGDSTFLGTSVQLSPVSNNELDILNFAGGNIAKFITGLTDASTSTYVTLQATGGVSANIYASGASAANLVLSGKGAAGGTVTLGLSGDNTILGSSVQLHPVSNNELDILNFAGSRIAKFVTGVTDATPATAIVMQATGGANASIYATNNTGTFGLLQVGVASTGPVEVMGNVGFYSTTPIAQPAPTGACASNTGCQALAAALGSLGLINPAGISN